MDQHTRVSERNAVAFLREATGQSYPLQQAATRIGRLSDNDIVLDTPKVSRHHAVIVDTGTSWVINDLRSSNGVHVQDERIRSATALQHGDHIRIGEHEFTFEVAAG
jgi:SARP family transcriptional regulator, regulator of embCAB operon